MNNKGAHLTEDDLARFQGLGEHQRAVMTILSKHTKGAYSSDIRRTLKVKSGVLTASYDGLERRGLIYRHYSFPPMLLFIQPTQMAVKYFRGEW